MMMTVMSLPSFILSVEDLQYSYCQIWRCVTIVLALRFSEFWVLENNNNNMLNLATQRFRQNHLSCYFSPSSPFKYYLSHILFNKFNCWTAFLSSNSQFFSSQEG